MLVDDGVHPPRAKRRAVTAFVPSRVGRRSVQDPVHEEERDRPPRGKQDGRDPSRRHHQSDPQDRVADGRPVAASHELFHALARHRRAVPLDLRQAALDSELAVVSEQGVVAHLTPVMGRLITRRGRHRTYPANVSTTTGATWCHRRRSTRARARAASSSAPPAISWVSSSIEISSLANEPIDWPRLRIRKRLPTGYAWRRVVGDEDHRQAAVAGLDDALAARRPTA